MRRLVLGLLAAGLLAGCAQGAVDPGVSLELARERAARISQVRYELAFRIPENKAEPLEGTEALTFTLRGRGPVQLDFREGADHLRRLTVNAQGRKPHRHYLRPRGPGAEPERRLPVYLARSRPRPDGVPRL